jgi:hypothetical protein
MKDYRVTVSTSQTSESITSFGMISDQSGVMIEEKDGQRMKLNFRYYYNDKKVQ